MFPLIALLLLVAVANAGECMHACCGCCVCCIDCCNGATMGTCGTDAGSNFQDESGTSGGSCAAFLYSGDNYSGRYIRVSEGWYTKSAMEMMGMRNNDVESVMLGDCMRVILWDWDNFQGDYHMLQQSDNNLWNECFDDKTTSFEVVGPYSRRRERRNMQGPDVTDYPLAIVQFSYFVPYQEAPIESYNTTQPWIIYNALKGCDHTDGFIAKYAAWCSVHQCQMSAEELMADLQASGITEICVMDVSRQAETQVIEGDQCNATATTATSATSDKDSSETSTSGVSPGAAAAIVIVVFLVMTVGFAAAWMWCLKPKNNKDALLNDTD